MLSSQPRNIFSPTSSSKPARAKSVAPKKKKASVKQDDIHDEIQDFLGARMLVNYRNCPPSEKASAKKMIIEAGFGHLLSK